ncbi:hypothetical protein [uncultured Oscillibacter sp.]|uniref:hypothetical protein n=1 Tax=uncultured Oscillibacter sp. TaxID=876091 RepID=UPI00280B29F0|nr:hypothetical protein [uncultured Oscillibacter sp.]
MNHHLTRSACALFAILSLLTAVLPAVRAEDRNLYVTGYTITSGGNTLSKLEKGSIADITVSIKDTRDGTGSSSPSSLDITKLDDSFSGGSISMARTSPDDAPLVYAVTLSGIKYKGTGQTLRLQVGRAGEPDSYQSISTELKYSWRHAHPGHRLRPHQLPRAGPLQGGHPRAQHRHPQLHLR